MWASRDRISSSTAFAGRERIAQDVKAQDVKAEVVKAHVVAEVVAEVVADNAACMQINIQARHEITAPEPVRPESASRSRASPSMSSSVAPAWLARGSAQAGDARSPTTSAPTKASSYTRNWGRDGFKLGDVARLTTADLPGHAALAWASFPCPDLIEGGRGEGPARGALQYALAMSCAFAHPTDRRTRAAG